MPHQHTRCANNARDALSEVVVIGWFTPVWITLKRGVNDCDARRVAAQLSDRVDHVLTDRVVVTHCEIGAVGVKTLHAAGGPPNSSRRTVELGTPWKQRVAIPGVAGVRSVERLPELRVSVDLGLRSANAALPFDPSDSTVRQRAGEPVARGERLPRIENGRNLHHDR